MHNAAFRALGLDAIYLAFDVDPTRLMEVLPAMAEMGFAGVNLTVPLKEVAFNGLTDLDRSARHLGAVNTVEFLANGKMRGHNTDGKGFLLAFEEAFGADLSGKSVFLLGSGGAGRAVAITCATHGATQVAVTDLDQKRSEKLSSEITQIVPGMSSPIVTATPDRWRTAARDADIVIQATPVGMNTGDKSLLGPDSFRPQQMVFDLIYMYPQTATMKAAVEGGARAANGLGMLLHQGAWAFTIWTGRSAAVAEMRTALENEVYPSS